MMPLFYQYEQREREEAGAARGRGGGRGRGRGRRQVPYPPVIMILLGQNNQAPAVVPDDSDGNIFVMTKKS